MGNNASSTNRVNENEVSPDKAKLNVNVNTTLVNTIGSTAPNHASSISPARGPKKALKESRRHGVVHVTINSLACNRRQPENENSHVITPRGAIFHGTQSSAAAVQRAIAQCGVPMLAPVEIPISDSRAHKLLIIHKVDFMRKLNKK